MDNEIFQELASLFFSTRQIIRAELPAGKIDPNAWLRSETLRYIAASGGPTMQEVAAYLRVKAPSATSLIANLAARGLVVRRGIARDKRVTRIYLTPRGRTILTASAKRSVAAVRAVFSKLSGAEIHELVRVLRRLRDIHVA
jgi:DNA-binding MarR family transcriptional regulator